MQLDFTPMPTTGDMMTADAPPAGGPAAGAVAPEGGDAAGQDQAGNQKGFRETMDDLLREAEAPAADGEGQVSAPSIESGDDPLPEGTLLEIASQPAQPQQTDAAALPRTGLVVASVGGETAQDPQLKSGQAAQDPQMKTEQAVQPKVDSLQSVVPLKDGETTPLNPDAKAAITTAAKAPKTDETALLPKAPVDSATSVTVAAEKLGLPKSEQPGQGNVHPTEAGKVSNDGEAQSKIVNALAPQPPESKKATAAPLFERAVRTAQPQGTSGTQTRLAAEPAATVEKPAAVTENQSQAVPNLVEGMEKGGGEAKPQSSVLDTPIEAVTTSGPKHTAAPQNSVGNIAKADPAAPQPLVKEEVVQQIVDSAKLRIQNGQSEMRIQLKPEHLGQVRLNIATDQHQVVVKVVAELPMVKELLESNLHQLRSDLQGQGLEIDKFDVSVGGDPDSQNKEQQTWGQRRGGRRGGAFAQADQEYREEEEQANRRGRQPAMERASEGVDYFA